MAELLSRLLGARDASSSSQRQQQPQQRTPTYSVARLQELYDRLSQFKESDLERPGGGEKVVEVVRQITEALVWGEQNDSLCFDFFCEKNLLAQFIKVLNLQKAPKTIKVQLLQTLSMLVQNIRRETSLYYILSGNYVNRLIAMPLDFSDEEILAYYITLLKSLALRLNGETIKFFFVHAPEPNFPLYIEATKFFGHRDQMVRATVRTITLQVYPIAFPPTRKFVLRHASESYFGELAYHLRELWLRLDAAVRSAKGDDLSTAQYENDLQQDLLIYLSDVFELQVTDLNEVLADRLLSGAMLPLLLPGVASPEGSGENGSSGPTGAGSRRSTSKVIFGASGLPPRVLAPGVALFLLRQVFDTFRSPVLLEPLAAALLQPEVPTALAYTLPPLLVESGLLPPLGSETEDVVANPLRLHFLKFLRSQHDGLFVFTVAMVHSCVRNRQALPASFAETAGILPPLIETGPSGLAQRPQGSGRARTEIPMDVMPLLLEALKQHEQREPIALQLLARVLLDLALEPATRQHAAVLGSIFDAVSVALHASAQRVRRLIQDSQAELPVLDAFLTEWDLHRRPLVNPVEVCREMRWLLAPPPTGRTADQEPAYASVRCFLCLRRLLGDLRTSAQPTGPAAAPPAAAAAPLGETCPGAGAAAVEEPSPFRVDREKLGSYQEGMSFEVGSLERIVCTMPLGDGKAGQRYLLLHDYWVLIAQPDLAKPGQLVVLTLWPVQVVQSLIDRGDPRTLWLGMQESVSDPIPGVASDLRGVRTLMLNFEDVNRCHAADSHLRRRRQEVRKLLLQRASELVEACCRMPPVPQPLHVTAPQVS